MTRTTGKSAIVVSGLGKEYALGERERYRALRDEIARVVRRLRPGGSAPSNNNGAKLWALRSVSFDVEQGEILGVIGRNGAGKSTLLKILSRVTPPTEGSATVYGRVGSLLEVGTGFHPELTGRENVFLNGAILGMRRAEIERKIPEILAFAEVDKFADTPVKRYSSGMYVRLAFAVAAHLDTPNLLIDEVLAVGDHAFQTKCLRKVTDVASSGRTILFVSHNLAAVRAICSRVIWISGGKLVADGEPTTVIEKYLKAAEGEAGDGLADLRRHPGRWPGKQPLLQQVRILDENGKPTSSVPIGAAFRFEVDVSLPPDLRKVDLWAGIQDMLGDRIAMLSSTFQPGGMTHRPGTFTVRCEIDELPLVTGNYFLTLWLEQGKTKVDLIENAIGFQTIAVDFFGSGRLPEGPGRGRVLFPARWSDVTQPTAVFQEAVR